MDGSLCAVLFRVAGGKTENIRFTFPSHDDSDDCVREALTDALGRVIVADASVSLSCAEQIDLQYKNIVIIDHHVSASPLTKFSWCKIDTGNTKCGSLSFYYWLLENTPKGRHSLLKDYLSLANIIDDYDRWQHNFPESHVFSMLFGLYGQKSFIERCFHNPSISLSGEEYFAVMLERRKLDNLIQQKKEEVSVIPVSIQGHSINLGIVHCYEQQSRIGHALCEDANLNIDIAMLVGTQAVSLRSSATCPVDLSILSKNNGGGGHFHASGVKINNILGKDFCDLVFEKMKF